MYTYWDEELGSYILTEEGKELSERDMINIMGNMEHGNRETKDDKKNIQHTCGRCKYEYVSPDCYPCNACNRQDLWEANEDE